MRGRGLTRIGLALLLGAGVATGWSWAQEEGGQESSEPVERVEDVVVVTASRTEQRLQEAPAAMTVITADELETSAVDDYGDVLRNVPGVNVSQISARDVQVTGRGATNSLATTQLVMVDNRSVYLDFFGFVIWEYLPSNPREIKQIEVVRGPGSAVWGANAMTGVVNLITKRPQEMQGTTVQLGVGELETAFGSVTHAAVTGDGSLGYKISGSYYEQGKPYDRPTGTIPGTNTPYPPFKNRGTSQPKFDLRFDKDVDDRTSWRASAGFAGTDGIIHTGIGPFDIDQGANLSFAQFDWTRGGTRFGVFANFLDGDATNLLTVGPTGDPLLLGFKSETYNVDFTSTKVVADRHIVTFGANARKNQFDLSIAPDGDNRDEYGAFAQDEILFGDKVRWLVGARWDDLDVVSSVVSPRTSLMISPTPDHTFRLSFNRAFRAPSLINNFLEITIINQVMLGPLPPAGNFIPYAFPTLAVGNPKLDEERLDAYEIGYVGSPRPGLTLSIAAYRNETSGSIDFFASSFYTASNPPPEFPLPVFLLDVPPPAGLQGVFPSSFSYRNVGKIVDRGVEVGLSGNPSRAWSWFANYSYQDKPDVSGIPPDEVNLPPENRANVGLAYSGSRFFASGNVNYQDDAFWTDVLDARFHGPTDAFTMVNLSVGIYVAGDRATFKIDAQNAFDEDVQQHVFGDIIGRKVTGSLLLSF